MSSRITIQYNNLTKIAARLPEAASEIVHKAAFDVKANAKAVVPVDTGKLKNSISSEFPTPTSAIIAPHTEYAHFVEYGTRKQRAQPYMRPAAEKVKAVFFEACRRLEERLK